MAPISGTIDRDDASPLAAAWRELHEETTLDAGSLQLLRQGKPFVLADPSVGREWTIHPFAFRLKTVREGGKGEEGICIDWEHEGWGWHDPLSVEDTAVFGGVPRLAESLRRVWFEKDLGEAAGAVLARGLATLRDDHQSGARQLAGVALGILKDVVRALEAHEPSDEWWVKVRFAAWHIWKNGREAMGAAIMSVLLDALRSIEDALRLRQENPESAHSVVWRDVVVGELERRIALRATSAADPVSDAFIRYLETHFSSRRAENKPVAILTLSESSTIAHCLRRLALESSFGLDIRFLESRPLFEGVSLAGSLARDIRSETAGDVKTASEVKLTIYTDASAALAAEDVDVVLIGADRIAASGAVSNKTGSLPAILSAKHVSPAVRAVVLGESEKIAPPEDPKEHVVEDNGPAQIVQAWNSDFNSDRVRSAAATLTGPVGEAGPYVQIRNVFFEWVPPELVDIYITEFGAWTVDDIGKRSRELGAERDRLFTDL